MEKDKVRYLSVKANKIRRNVIEAVYHAASGHPGGALSVADIMAVLYFDVLNVDPANPHWEDRDRLVLSKGHTCPALYGALAEKGYFPQELIKTFRSIDSILQGHPEMKNIPGVDMSTGSLGQGLSAANGMALAGKIDKKDYRVYAILGDGEIQEGQIWEAAMFAAHYKLDNLTAFLDNNGLQIDGPIAQVMNPNPIDEKFAAFGWHVLHIDGHNIAEIKKAVSFAKEIKDKPVIIMAQTIKGKNVSFMENQVGWHGSAPNEEQYKQALKELNALIDELEVN